MGGQVYAKSLAKTQGKIRQHAYMAAGMADLYAFSARVNQPENHGACALWSASQSPRFDHVTRKFDSQSFYWNVLKRKNYRCNTPPGTNHICSKTLSNATSDIAPISFTSLQIQRVWRWWLNSMRNSTAIALNDASFPEWRRYL